AGEAEAVVLAGGADGCCGRRCAEGDRRAAPRRDSRLGRPAEGEARMHEHYERDNGDPQECFHWLLFSFRGTSPAATVFSIRSARSSTRATTSRTACRVGPLKRKKQASSSGT